MTFTTRITVRFGEVDRAGIVYYPNILHYCHVVFEEFFAGHVGTTYAVLVEERAVGFPTVKLDTSFDAPFRYGATARGSLDVLDVGRSSTRWRYAFHDGATLLATSVHTTVAVDMNTLAPIPIPDDLRRAFLTCRP